MYFRDLCKVLLAGVVLFAASTALGAEKDPDPWESFNRKMFKFNDTLDVYVLRPVAKGYRTVTPDVVETGVSNVFSNLLEVRNVLNNLLQGKLGQAGNDTGRFLINSTVGLAGIFDVAGYMGLPRGDGEDFGQTFATWGSGQGPYLVLPFLGSTTLRDAFGIPLNSYTMPYPYIDDVATRNTLYGVSMVDTRARLLDAESLLSGDKYAFVRDAFLQRREYLIHDGEVEDDFGGDFGGEFGGYDDEFGEGAPADEFGDDEF